MSELIVIEELQTRSNFTERNVEKAVAMVEDFIGSLTQDVSTKKGRDEIRSMARKIASSKTALDNARKEHGKNLREELQKINDVGKLGIERLQVLQENYRKPLTDFEQAEKKRTGAHEENIAKLESLLVSLPGITNKEELQAARETFNDAKERDFEEYAEQAQAKIKQVQAVIDAQINKVDQLEKERAELEQLRKERAELDALRAEKAAAEAAKNTQQPEAQHALGTAKPEDVASQPVGPAKSEQSKSVSFSQDAAKQAQADIENLGVPGSFAQKIVQAIADGKVRNVALV